MVNQQLKNSITLQTLIWGLKNNPDTMKDSKGNFSLITHEIENGEGWIEREEMNLSLQRDGDYLLVAGTRDLASNTFIPEYSLSVPKGSLTYKLDN
jgi:hypothetical protein